MPTPDDDDLLDGMCDDVEVEFPTADEDAPYVALFADLLDETQHVTDEDAVARRTAEWQELSDGL